MFLRYPEGDVEDAIGYIDRSSGRATSRSPEPKMSSDVPRPLWLRAVQGALPDTALILPNTGHGCSAQFPQLSEMENHSKTREKSKMKEKLRRYCHRIAIFTP